MLDFLYSLFSFGQIRYVNNDCPVCMKDKNAIPNKGGRFFIVDDEHCVCNGCGNKFKKSEYYVDVSQLDV